MHVDRTRLGSSVPETIAPSNRGPKKGTWEKRKRSDLKVSVTGKCFFLRHMSLKSLTESRNEHEALKQCVLSHVGLAEIMITLFSLYDNYASTSPKKINKHDRPKWLQSIRNAALSSLKACTHWTQHWVICLGTDAAKGISSSTALPSMLLWMLLPLRRCRIIYCVLFFFIFILAFIIAYKVFNPKCMWRWQQSYMCVI